MLGDKMSTGTKTTSATEAFRQYMRYEKGRLVVKVIEGKYKGWVPKMLYTMDVDELYLPFLKLMSFPVGGTALDKLINMKVFHAVGNYLIRLPNSFAYCSHLDSLNLSFNNLEQIPMAVYKLSNLVELDLSDNNISSLQPEIGNLVNLRILNLHGNSIENVPEELNRCKNLSKLLFSGKWYPRKGLKSVPPAICNLPELTELDLSWHQIQTLPDHVGNMRKLQLLNLKGNFLKYVSANIQLCTHLQVLNLTGALKLCSQIPTEFFSLPELKRLDMSGNYFTEIPPEISKLTKLRVFCMQRNALLVVPKELFVLQSLEQLDLSENYLLQIPGSIRKLQKLKSLAVVYNKLKELPDGICECKSLETLYIGLNAITHLPQQLYKLQNLKELSAENNQLKELPLLLDRLEKLKESGNLYLYNNYLVRPPQQICDQGVDGLFSYLKELRISEATHRRKMILIGAVKAGKTSLRHALSMGISKLTAEHERTWVLDRHLWEPEADLRVQILDFGGHHIYSAAHHMFLTPEAMHLVIFDCSKYTPEEYNYRVGDWLDAIADRAPGATVLLIGTHADMCTEEEINERSSDILQRMHSEEKCKIDDLRAELRRLDQILESPEARDAGQSFVDIDVARMRDKAMHLRRMLNTRVTLPNNVFVVSCAEDLAGIDDLRSKLISKLKDSEQRPLPQSWYRFLMTIQERPEKILTWDNTLEIFSQVMTSMGQSMMSLEGSVKSSLALILKYLHATGEIVWYHENPKLQDIIFHRPETLVEMLRAIFRHDFEAVVKFNETFGRMVGLTQKRFEMAKEDFLKRGIMSTELLEFSLHHFHLSINALGMFVSLMLKFDLCYEILPSASNPGIVPRQRVLQFPWFLSSELPDDFDMLWPAIVPANNFELRLEVQFPNRGAPNFFEKTCVRLQDHVFDRVNWRDGVFARRNRTKLLLRRKTTDTTFTVTLSVRGSDLQEMWFLILNPWHDMFSLLREWPFIRYDRFMACPHCILCRVEEPYLYQGEVLDIRCPKGIYQIHCPQGRAESWIPACFVYPLDPDFQDDLPVHIKSVMQFLQTYNEDVVDFGGYAGVVSDQGLSFIAANLGLGWQQIAIGLGVPSKHLEQIQINYPSEVFRQIFNALIWWRDSDPDKSSSEMTEQLLVVLTESEQNSLADDLKVKYKIDS